MCKKKKKKKRFVFARQIDSCIRRKKKEEKSQYSRGRNVQQLHYRIIEHNNEPLSHRFTIEMQLEFTLDDLSRRICI
jgi:hypothetical protein